VSVQDCTINGNKANGTMLAEGGGIYSDDTVLSLVASNVKGNKARTAGDDIFIHP
jgi:predicted outer membrane repeat protein